MLLLLGGEAGSFFGSQPRFVFLMFARYRGFDKGASSPSLKSPPSQLSSASQAPQRRLRVNKESVGGGGYYSVFFIFLLVKLYVPLEDKVKYLP